MYAITRPRYVNSLAPGGFENIFQNVFFKLISWIDTLSNSCETALRSMPQNPSDDKSTLVQVMAWCRQAAGHYLSQCCPRSLSPYAITRPRYVNNHRIESVRILCLVSGVLINMTHLINSNRGIKFTILGLYSPSGRTFDRRISWSLEATRSDVTIVASLWNLTGISVVLLPRCLSNFRAIRKV